MRVQTPDGRVLDLDLSEILPLLEKGKPYWGCDSLSLGPANNDVIVFKCGHGFVLAVVRPEGDLLYRGSTSQTGYGTIYPGGAGWILPMPYFHTLDDAWSLIQRAAEQKHWPDPAWVSADDGYDLDRWRIEGRGEIPSTGW